MLGGPVEQFRVSHPTVGSGKGPGHVRGPGRQRNLVKKRENIFIPAVPVMVELNRGKRSSFFQAIIFEPVPSVAKPSDEVGPLYVHFHGESAGETQVKDEGTRWRSTRQNRVYFVGEEQLRCGAIRRRRHQLPLAPSMLADVGAMWARVAIEERHFRPLAKRA